MTLATEQISELAAHLVDLPGITNLSLDAKKHELTVSIREPMTLYEKLLQLSQHNGLVIQRISGADGDLSSLFKALTARHQGQRS